MTSFSSTSVMTICNVAHESIQSAITKATRARPPATEEIVTLDIVNAVVSPTVLPTPKTVPTSPVCVCAVVGVAGVVLLGPPADVDPDPDPDPDATVDADPGVACAARSSCRWCSCWRCNCCCSCWRASMRLASVASLFTSSCAHASTAARLITTLPTSVSVHSSLLLAVCPLNANGVAMRVEHTNVFIVQVVNHNVAHELVKIFDVRMQVERTYVTEPVSAPVTG